MRSAVRSMFVPGFASGKFSLRLGLATLASLALLAVANPAHADDFRLSRASVAQKLAAVGRQKAAAGDCKAALDYFDFALRTSMDPTVFRDRGLCHEKEGNVRPAIDDLRTYLAASPGANDAAAIADRLRALQERVECTESEHPAGGGEQAAGNGKQPQVNNCERKRDPFGSAGESKGEKAKSEKDPSTRSYDDEVSRIQKVDEAFASSLRRANGGSLGALLGVRRLFRPSEVDGYWVGLSGRYAFSEYMSAIVDVSFVANGKSGTTDYQSGMSGVLSAERRMPLDGFASHQLFVGVGIGFEHVTSPGATTNLLYLPRARFGYRYLVASTVAIEGAVDGGLHYQLAGDGVESQLYPTLGLHGGLVVGF